jgi:hypothetical protein
VELYFYSPGMLLRRGQKPLYFTFSHTGYIEKNEMGGAFGAYGGGERGAQGVGGES